MEKEEAHPKINSSRSSTVVGEQRTPSDNKQQKSAPKDNKAIEPKTTQADPSYEASSKSKCNNDFSLQVAQKCVTEPCDEDGSSSKKKYLMNKHSNNNGTIYRSNNNLKATTKGVHCNTEPCEGDEQQNSSEKKDKKSVYISPNVPRKGLKENNIILNTNIVSRDQQM